MRCQHDVEQTNSASLYATQRLLVSVSVKSEFQLKLWTLDSRTRTAFETHPFEPYKAVSLPDNMGPGNGFRLFGQGMPILEARLASLMIHRANRAVTPQAKST